MNVSNLNSRGRKFNAVDLQNATLAGGVVVGAVSDLMLQPYAAVMAGSVAGIVATFGYQVLQVRFRNLFVSTSE